MYVCAVCAMKRRRAPFERIQRKQIGRSRGSCEARMLVAGIVLPGNFCSHTCVPKVFDPKTLNVHDAALHMHWVSLALPNAHDHPDHQCPFKPIYGDQLINYDSAF